MKIKAYAIKKRGGRAELFTYERKVGKNDVLVTITHCSIARGDIQFINDDWGDTKFPWFQVMKLLALLKGLVQK